MLKNHFVYLLLPALLLSGVLHAQDTGAGVKETTFTSAILNKEVTILVRLPENYEASPASYTVLYYIQGTNETVEEIASLAAEMHKEKNTPEMIVVSIDIPDENLDRMLDLARYDQFLASLEQEAMPAIEKKYRTNGQRIVYEKSLEGSLALYALLTKPTLFHGYIAASKQWYEGNNDYFTGLAGKEFKSQSDFYGKKIFLATLNGAYNNNNIPEVDKQMQEFTTLLMSKSRQYISAKYQAFDEWGITPQPGFNEGLLFVASKLNAATNAIKKEADSKSWLNAESTYRELKNGEKAYAFNETEIDELGMEYLKKGAFQKAIFVLGINSLAYPFSYKAFERYGDALMQAGNPADAYMQFKKSVELNPDNNLSAKKMAQIDAAGWRTITGIVVDEGNEPLIGTSVAMLVAFGNKSYTVNDVDGVYRLKIHTSCKALKYNWDAGYGTDTVALTASDTLNVLLVNNSNWENTVDTTVKSSNRNHSIRITGEIVGIPATGFHPYVRIIGTSTRISPDASGRFELFLPPGHDFLSFEAEGYSSRLVRVPNVTQLHIPSVNLYKKGKSKKRSKN